jgi:hypothetical protein
MQCVFVDLQIQGHPLGGITLLDLEEKHLLDTHNSSNNASSSSSNSSTPCRLQRHYRDANSSSTSSAALDCCAASAAMRRQRRALDLQVSCMSIFTRNCAHCVSCDRVLVSGKLLMLRAIIMNRTVTSVRGCVMSFLVLIM